MTVDELARRRAENARRLAGAKKRPPPPALATPEPGDLGVIVEDLRGIRGMTEEVMSEALALESPDLIAEVGALILHVTDVETTARRILEGGEQ